MSGFARTPVLQRKCSCGGVCSSYTGKREPVRRHAQNTAAPDEIRKPEEKGFAFNFGRVGIHPQRSPVDSAEPATVSPIVQEVLRSPGQPLDASARSFMAARFGHDFSQVRVHTDAMAAESARAVDALAYTAGAHIVFQEGRYAPNSVEGSRLLAHELAHSVQQGFAGVQPGKQPVSISEDQALETEADRASERVLAGDNVGSVRVVPGGSGLHLFRKPPPVSSPADAGQAPAKQAGTTATVQATGHFKGAQMEAQFPIRLDIAGLPGACKAIRWEHFAGGSFDVHDDKGDSLVINACDYIRKNVNPNSKQFGALCDDITEGEQRGPKPIKAPAYCEPEGPQSVRYYFTDGPGLPLDFGVQIPEAMVGKKMGKLTTIEYNLTFQHKLWTGEPEVRAYPYTISGKRTEQEKSGGRVAQNW